jgi:hypothetical protein
MTTPRFATRTSVSPASCAACVRNSMKASRIYRCRDGVTYLGWRLYPGLARLPRK